jgi:hypothetical protein
MKKLIIILITASALTACTPNKYPAPADRQVNQQALKDEHLMLDVSHGLHKITLNDSTTILIYRGVESCTMIQLK